jgi:hypothetical protein
MNVQIQNPKKGTALGITTTKSHSATMSHSATKHWALKKWGLAIHWELGFDRKPLRTQAEQFLTQRNEGAQRAAKNIGRVH